MGLFEVDACVGTTVGPFLLNQLTQGQFFFPSYSLVMCYLCFAFLISNLLHFRSYKPGQSQKKKKSVYVQAVFKYLAMRQVNLQKEWLECDLPELLHSYSGQWLKIMLCSVDFGFQWLPILFMAHSKKIYKSCILSIRPILYYSYRDFNPMKIKQVSVLLSQK